MRESITCFVCVAGEIKIKWNKLCENSIRVKSKKIKFTRWTSMMGMSKTQRYVCARRSPHNLVCDSATNDNIV